MKEIKNIFKTVAYVTAFSFAERFLGFIYRIFLSRKLGAEGLGIYQISLSVLGLFMTITSSGIPITVSRLITKTRAETGKNVTSEAVTAGILLAIAIAAPLTLLSLFDNGVLNLLFSDDRCKIILRIMIPGLIFTSVYAVLRGSFWGNSRFLTYSVIEFAEEFVMTVVGVILVNLTTDMMTGVKFAGVAVLVSYLFSFTTASIAFLIRGGRIKKPKSQLKPLIVSSVPVTSMRTATSLISTLIAVLLPARLIYYGMGSSAAIGEFGKIFGMAFPLVSMPSTIIGSLAVVLVPELSSNYYSAKYATLKNNVEKAIKFSVFAACLIIPVFLSLGREIGVFLYDDEIAGSYVVKAAAMTLPLSITIISTSMLNSLNKEKTTLLFYLSGASLMLLCIYFLPKYLGVNSLIAGMAISYVVSSVANVILLYKVSPVKPKILAYISVSCLFIIPSTLLGLLAKNLLFARLPHAVALIVCVVAVGLFQLGLFYVFGMTDFKAEHHKYGRNPLTENRSGKNTKIKA